MKSYNGLSIPTRRPTLNNISRTVARNEVGVGYTENGASVSRDMLGLSSIAPRFDDRAVGVFERKTRVTSEQWPRHNTTRYKDTFRRLTTQQVVYLRTLIGWVCTVIAICMSRGAFVYKLNALSDD